MNDTPPGPARSKTPKAATIGLLAAGAVIGGIVASTLSASAAPSPTPSAGTSTAPDTKAPDRSPTSMRSDEKTLTGTDAEKAKAAALAAVPGGTVYRVETDGDGAAYEAHMVKADGTEVTVKMDSSFKVTGTEAGHGAGGRGGHGGPGGPGRPNDGDADDAAGSSTSTPAA